MEQSPGNKIVGKFFFFKFMHVMYFFFCFLLVHIHSYVIWCTCMGCKECFFFFLFFFFCMYYRDSSCACFTLNGRERYGRLQRFFVESRLRSGTKKFHATVKIHQKLRPGGTRIFKYAVVLYKRQRARLAVIQFTDIIHKCIFLSISTLPTVARGTQIILAKKLLVHVIDPDLLARSRG